MVLKIPTLAPGYRKELRSGCRDGFQDHGSEGVQTMVSARVGTMQVQAIMPPLMNNGPNESQGFCRAREFWAAAKL